MRRETETRHRDPCCPILEVRKLRLRGQEEVELERKLSCPWSNVHLASVWVPKHRDFSLALSRRPPLQRPCPAGQVDLGKE